jgi:hypothetical protein
MKVHLFFGFIGAVCGVQYRFCLLVAQTFTHIAQHGRKIYNFVIKSMTDKD